MPTKYFHAENSNRKITVDKLEFTFEPYEVFGGSWMGVYKAEREDESAALSSLTADPKTAVTEISAAEYDKLRKKKAVTSYGLKSLEQASNAPKAAPAPVAAPAESTKAPEPPAPAALAPSVLDRPLTGETAAVVLAEPVTGESDEGPTASELSADDAVKVGEVQPAQPETQPAKVKTAKEKAAETRAAKAAAKAAAAKASAPPE
jgi:hypothetical protein